MKFNYIAQTKKGEGKTGVIDASGLEEAKKRLLEEDLVLLSIEPIIKRKKAIIVIPFISRVSFLDKFLFVKHLAMMIKTGLPLREAIVEIKEQTRSKKFKKVLDDIISQVDNGKSLADSLSRHPAVFDELFVNLIKAGEASGTLEDNLKYLALQLEKAHDLGKKIKAALLYPALILISTFGLVAALALFIMPKLIPLFESFDIELPLPTRILLWLIRIIQNYSLFVIFWVLFLALVFIFISRLRSVKTINHRIILKLPLIRKLNKNINLAYFARTLGTLVKSGVPIVEAFNITARTLSNVVYQEQLKKVTLRIQRGEAIATYFRKKPELFPPVFSRMISVGEKTGKLEESLFYLADFYENEVDSITKNISTVLEPFLLIIIGVLIGFIAVSIIMPIYEITHSLSRLRR
jgi:type IV pilus assembly protein PilC